MNILAIHDWNDVMRVKTDGCRGAAHLTPKLVSPTKVHSPVDVARQARGPPLSPLHELVPP